MTKEKLKKEGFKITDPSNNQWIKKITETNFLVYEKERLFDIELNEYTEEELLDEVSGYYSSLGEIKMLYGEDANQIIAECIAESDYS